MQGKPNTKTLGLIGGMSWESSAEYYRLLNEGAKARLGGHHNARSLMLSVDFDEIEALQRTGDWAQLGVIMAQAARQLEAGGAGCVVLCTNTMHRLWSAMTEAITIPLLHIADPTGRAISDSGFKRVGLLGTRFTMEQDFYRGRLESQFGLSVSVPDAADRDIVHRIIYDELCHGIISEASRAEFQRIIRMLRQQGAQCVILGCTEIMLLIQAHDSDLPVFDTTRLHVEAALDWLIDK